MAERDQNLIDEGRRLLEDALPEAIGTLRRGGLTEREIRDVVARQLPDPEFDPPLLCGLPIDDVHILTFDGRIWIEILGVIKREVQEGLITLTMKVAQVPGGKTRKFGLGPGDTITFRPGSVVAVGSQFERVR